MVRRVIVAVGAVLVLLGVLVSPGRADAATYYGQMPGIYSTSGWLGDNPHYSVMSATGRAQPLKVYKISPSVFGFDNPKTGYLYADTASPCGAWLCNDDGGIAGSIGTFVVHCYPGHPGWFSLWNAYQKRWGVLVPLKGGYTIEFVYPTDPIRLSFPNGGVFYSYVVGYRGAWCGR